MPRIRKGAARRRKHKRILRAARGYYGAASRHYRLASQMTFRAGVMATRDRQRRKRDFRRLWITRITAACKQRGIQYSRLIFALGEANIALNRKMLSEIAIADPPAFDAVVEAATGAGKSRKKTTKKAAKKSAKKSTKRAAKKADKK
jgi:large subunit ribosomal protein L20